MIRGTSFAFLRSLREKNQPLREKILSVYESFFIFAIGERNKAFEFLTFEKEEQKETKNNL